MNQTMKIKSRQIRSIEPPGREIGVAFLFSSFSYGDVSPDPSLAAKENINEYPGSFCLHRKTYKRT